MSQHLTKFTKEVDSWIESHCPHSMRTPMPVSEQVWASSNIYFPSKDAKVWFDAMVSKGWCTPEWPKEFGGGGLTFDESKILKQRLKFYGCRPAQINFGISMLGPVLLEFGTDEQKHEFLPQISRGEIWWCQGFSEPGAGSDLANISTTATLKGGQYMIEGSKIWTSEANKADWMYCLVRTNKTVKKQAGISFVLLDLNQPNIDIKPIQLLSGQSPFCQVFFDNVYACETHRIAPENDGWKVAKRLLQFERTMMADMESEGAIDVEPLKVFRDSKPGSSPGSKKLLAKIATHEMRNHMIEITMSRTAAESQNGFSPTGLTLKYLSTEETQNRWELNVSSLGMGGLEIVDRSSGVRKEVSKSFFYSKAYTIAGGSSEVQLNIISKNILGLTS
ncbi:acyl-CoA dehydrogenase family protein [Gammaproteobacteria bacterium]|nr:acyl-CoA dehydrogenase family protein [Gammaproteobacteria bacterium]MDA9365057.1 acyl-CoA dehydrogenase family protein [Gammaproteobacteria bacterium]MDA9370896.1 acyl-CoA dehydrogenase family protein [Gammaproteobacteria bacterium]MDA9973752.1 acyl-CoA dehydrogenase family protein [Gammaproteobacteria bacterium]MDC1475590.1 acyl-CoA dehydrogenase family protein [Gammaproteobacteria bacterium]|tara:strand:+ start:1473 stop:2645 length:1173 start_codon:yes stop_codon:yes gene_type:complete